MLEQPPAYPPREDDAFSELGYDRGQRTLPDAHSPKGPEAGIPQSIPAGFIKRLAEERYPHRKIGPPFMAADGKAYYKVVREGASGHLLFLQDADGNAFSVLTTDVFKGMA